MVDIRQILEVEGLYGSSTIMISFILILIGVWDQNGIFPSPWLASQCLLFRPHCGGMSDRSSDDESERVCDDPDDLYGL